MKTDLVNARVQQPLMSGCEHRPMLRRSGATVIRLMVDPPAGHGGFLGNPRYVNLVLGDFARGLAGR